MYKTLGMIGGMGPAATADLLLKITKLTDAKRDQDHVHVIIDSNINIPDRTAAILHGGEDPLPELTASAKLLENAGADMIIMACNTAHYFATELAKATSLPIISMPEETAHLLKKRGIKKVALLATDGTVQSGVYQNVLDAEEIETIYPNHEQQALIMSVIYNYIKRGILDASKLPVREVLDVCIDLKKRGAEAVLLACTELPVAFDVMGLLDESCVDPTEVLAAAAVKAAGAPVRE